jgi:hypothetical protein
MSELGKGFIEGCYQEYKEEELEHYLARAVRLLKVKKPDRDELREKETVIKDIKGYFDKKFKGKKEK